MEAYVTFYFLEKLRIKHVFITPFMLGANCVIRHEHHALVIPSIPDFVKFVVFVFNYFIHIIFVWFVFLIDLNLANVYRILAGAAQLEY